MVFLFPEEPSFSGRARKSIVSFRRRFCTDGQGAARSSSVQTGRDIFIKGTSDEIWTAAVSVLPPLNSASAKTDGQCALG